MLRRQEEQVVASARRVRLNCLGSPLKLRSERGEAIHARPKCIKIHLCTLARCTRAALSKVGPWFILVARHIQKWSRPATTMATTKRRGREGLQNGRR